MHRRGAPHDDPPTLRNLIRNLIRSTVRSTGGNLVGSPVHPGTGGVA